MSGESPMTPPGAHHRFGLCNRGANGVSKYRTPLPCTTQNAVIHTILLVTNGELSLLSSASSSPVSASAPKVWGEGESDRG
jgi:hypothetical protein